MNIQHLAYSEIERLVKEFKNIPAAQRKGMNEMKTRLGYILPMFKALGWDTSNINEVSPEEKVSRGWVDFSFRIGNVPRFFLETKRADENLNDPRWVKQAIDYAWTKSVTWALLSDFEGLQVFNAEVRVENDPFQAKFLEFDLDTYLSDFDRLWWLSRPETVEKRLDREAEYWNKKSKRQPVSQHLFDNLKRWRGLLYKDYKNFNPILAASADAIVLRLLNRLIFIRTAEDREVEQYRLQPLVRELEAQGRFKDLPTELSRLFREFDKTYNSELFAPHSLDGSYATPSVLKEVIEGLYGANFMQYNFNAIEADVLGTAYEQYLGSIVMDDLQDISPIQPSLLGDDVLPVQERRRKRKSQGIYYTPAFVTKYIVKQTVGKYLEENGYNPSKPPRVLDMACGSGSFLIEAFDLIDDFVAKQRGQAQKGEVDFYDRARQIEVLQNCIFGVDKDKQAVEVARLNLLLRGLHSREKLPMLENVANGDSLQSDTYPSNFPQVMKDGGFDVIVGNPPYVRAENMSREDRDYFMSGEFETVYGRFDIFILFIERAIKLLKDGGRLSLIVPHPILNENYAKLTRSFILNSCAIESIIDLSDYKVFQNATVATCILVVRKELNFSIRQNNRIKIIKQETYSDGIDHETLSATFITQSVFDDTPQNSFRLEFDNSSIAIIDKIDRQSVAVGDLCYVITGAVMHNPKTGESKERLIHNKTHKGLKPYIEAKEITRYVPPINTRYMEYRDKEMHRPKFPELFENKKIMVQMVAGDNGLIATYDENNLYTDHSLHLCVLKSYLFGVKRSQIKITKDEAQFAKPYRPEFILAHINSRMANFYFRRKLEGGLNIYPETVRQLPIYRIDFDKPAEKSAHDAIVKLVEKMLALKKERQFVRPEDEYDLVRNLDREIARVDSEIDQLVYKLYGLTEQEIKVIEGG